MTHTQHPNALSARVKSGSEGYASTFPPCSVHICQKPDQPSQTCYKVQLLKANPKWENWRQMKENAPRTIDNAVQIKKKLHHNSTKSNYKSEKQQCGT